MHGRRWQDVGDASKTAACPATGLAGTTRKRAVGLAEAAAGRASATARHTIGEHSGFHVGTAIPLDFVGPSKLETLGLAADSYAGLPIVDGYGRADLTGSR